MASVVSSNPNGVSINYGYDSLNRLATVTDNRITPGVTTYAYNDVGGVVTVTYPNNVVHTYNYDVTDRVTSVPVTRGGTTLASYTHTFNFAGHKLTATEYSGRVATYTYDAVYKLATETVTNDPPNNGGLTYAHDSVGNRLSLTSTLGAIPSATYSYDPNDRLNVDTYDANGNTITSAGVNYGYDFEDRMTSAGAVTMIYDGDGNRVSKTASGTTTRYLVDDLTPTGYAQVAEELVGGAVTVRYTHGLQRISQTRSGATHFYGYDGGGSVRQLTDTAGAVTDTYTYDSFGVLISGTGSTVNSYRYRGEQWDASVGMYYLRTRWHEPGRGRFMSLDTWEGKGCSPPSLNGYLFGEADPVNKSDPSGHAALEKAALGPIVLAVATAVTATALVYDYQLRRNIRVNSTGRSEYCIFHLDWNDLLLTYSVSVALELVGPCVRRSDVKESSKGRARTKPVVIPRDPENDRICTRLRDLCMQYGKRKPCGDCYRNCMHNDGAWPFKKCPLDGLPDDPAEVWPPIDPGLPIQ